VLCTRKTPAQRLPKKNRNRLRLAKGSASFAEQDG
jgi:hypothetical protein